MLLWMLGLLLLLAASALLASFVVGEMVPMVVEVFMNGDDLAALLLATATIAMALIAVMGGVVGPLTHRGELRRRLMESKLATTWRSRRLRRQAVTSPEPVMAVKLANVHWDDPDAEPEFSGASAGRVYRREAIAHCGSQPTDALCVDQQSHHRCGFYALANGNALLAELTGLSEAQAVEAYDWRDVLEACDDTTHVVTVALHGEVMTYDTGVRGQRQTVTGIDVPAACHRERCAEPVDAVAAVGYPLVLCARHASSPELAERTLSLDEFARRFDLALRPTTATGRPASHPSHHGPSTLVPTPAIAQEPTVDTPVDHSEERVEGWLTGSFDLDGGRLVTDTHQLSADTRTGEPVTAARDVLPPPPGQALARVRLGGEVVVRRKSVTSRDVQIWDLYLPRRCQDANCQHAAQLVDRDASLAVARCRWHASASARPATQLGADHGMAIRLGA